MRVHERGVGETQSCGTGACAAAVAIRHWAGQGAPDAWNVDVPGGVVGVKFFPAPDGHEHVELSGPAVIVRYRDAFLTRRNSIRKDLDVLSRRDREAGRRSSAASQRCSESEPRFFCTTSQAEPPGASRGSHSSSRAWSSSLPIRIGGLDQMVSKRSSGSTSSGVLAVDIVQPQQRGVFVGQATQRSLTSTA